MKLTIDKQERRFRMDFADTSYAVEIAERDLPINLYWGSRLDRNEDLPSCHDLQCNRHRGPECCCEMRQEYPVFFGAFQEECCLKAAYSDKVRRICMKYEGHEFDGTVLKLKFRDAEHPLRFRLCYREAGANLDLLERWSEIENTGTDVVELENYASAAWHLPQNVTDWRLTHLSGHWGKENMPSTLPVTQGKFVMESRSGLSNSFHAPYFALDNGNATEEIGEVYFGALAWSGNWKITVERDGYFHTDVIGGINEFDNLLMLRPGEIFTTPVFYGGRTENGFGGACRLFHRLSMDVLLPKEIVKKPMPVMFNSWGCIGVNVNEENLLRAIDKAEKIGAELFVIDDGWQRALGDWFPDPEKFPKGLAPIIRATQDKGMIFGLWVEVESFELKSRLYQEHPDWQMKFPGCKPFIKERGNVGRQSVMLDFSNPETAEYIYRLLYDLVKTTGIKYLKLDMNCFVSSPFGKGRIWIDYVNNLTGVFSRLSKEFPDLLMENCAAGGGRANLSMNRMFGRINRSDNQDPLDMVKLHYNFTFVEPPRMAGGACHISDSMYNINLRHAPLRFQAACGMLGSLACGKDLTACSDAELAEIHSYTDLYKKLRHVTNFGDLYRLSNPHEQTFGAYWYVARDGSEGVLILLGQNIEFADRMPYLRLPGLEENTIFQIDAYFNENKSNGYSGSITDYAPTSGKALAKSGLTFELLGDYDAKILHIRKI